MIGQTVAADPARPAAPRLPAAAERAREASLSHRRARYEEAGQASLDLLERRFLLAA